MNKRYWTYDKCLETAQSFNHRVDFQRAYSGAYTACQRNGWLNDVCEHMKPLGNLKNRLIYSYEFSDNSVYIGLTNDINRRHNDRLCDTNDPVTVHMNETNLIPIRKELTEYIEVNQAKLMEIKWEHYYKSNGWNILNRVKTGNHIGCGTLKWTKHEYIKISSTFSKLSEFKKQCRGAYASIKNHNWFDECCDHMKRGKPNGYWNKKRCLHESKKYNNRIEFRQSQSAYVISCKNKWLDEFYK